MEEEPLQQQEEYEVIRDLPMGCLYAGFALICVTIVILIISIVRFNPLQP